MTYNKSWSTSASDVNGDGDIIITPSRLQVSKCDQGLDGGWCPNSDSGPRTPRAPWEARRTHARLWPASTQRPRLCGVGFCGAGRCFENDASILLRSTPNQKRLPDGALVQRERKEKWGESPPGPSE